MRLPSTAAARWAQLHCFPTALPAPLRDRASRRVPPVPPRRYFGFGRLDSSANRTLKLIEVDELGYVHSPSVMAYQALVYLVLEHRFKLAHEIR